MASRALISLLISALVALGPVGGAAAQVPESRAEIALTFAPLVERVGPAVVNVYTRATVSERPRVSPLFDDPFFKRFFGDLMPGLPERRREANSLGSGVIVDPSGIVMTNHHVVDGADEITVVLSDRREFDARVLLADPRTDLAVLRIDAGGDALPAVEIDDSDDLAVGDLVLAIGNPFGVGQTVTMGIVSALARTNVGISDYSFFIQTDAAINPGNSGGALIGVDGKLVGINTAIFSNQRGPSAGSVGIGFAVPSNMVAAVLRAVDTGKVVRPWLGARTQSVTSDLAQGLGLDRPAGALISEIYPGGPADRAGLQAGDVVIEVDGRPVLDAGGLRYRVGTRQAGDRITARVLRQSRELTVTIDLRHPTDEPAPDVTDLGGRNPLAGARVANLSPDLALEEGFDPYERGVVVLGVLRGSPAHRIRLQRGDVILKINDRPIDTVGALRRALDRAGGRWLMSIRRGDQVLTTEIQG